MLDHDILDYILLNQIWPKLPVCPQKGCLRENWLTLVLCNYCFTMLKHFKRILTTDHEIKGCVRFWTNLVQNYWFAFWGDVLFLEYWQTLLLPIVLQHDKDSQKKSH